MEFRSLLTRFLNSLEDYSGEYPEINDTDVREAIAEVLNRYFVWGHAPETAKPPVNFGMFSVAGNLAVSGAVQDFLTAALALPVVQSTPPGERRHALLQDLDAKTRRGETYYLFFGHSDDVLRDEPLWSGRFELESDEDEHG